jgi:hypothetical protein
VKTGPKTGDCCNLDCSTDARLAERQTQLA